MLPFQLDCCTNHPLEPTTPVSLTDTPVCIACVLTTVAHESLLLTVRQAALAQLASLPSDPRLLCTLCSSTLSRMHSRLLAVLFATNTPDPLVQQVTTFLAQLSQACDTKDHHRPSYIAHVLSASVNATLQGSPNRTVALLAAILTPATRQQFTAILSTNALAFTCKLLSVQYAVQAWPHLAIVLVETYATAAPQLAPREVLPALNGIMTTRKQPIRDAAYLSIIHAVVKYSDTLLDCSRYLISEDDTFLPVVKNALMTANKQHALIAISIIVKTAQAPTVASALCEKGVVEYIMESLRGTPRFLHALDALSAMAQSRPSALVSKWTYAFNDLVVVSESISRRHLPALLSVFHCAFETAPTPVFTQHSVQQFVAFVMRLFMQLLRSKGPDADTKTNDLQPIVESALRCLLVLLGRYRLSIESVHSVISVYELSAEGNCIIVTTLQIFVACANQFERLVKLNRENEGTEHANGTMEDVRTLGGRLVLTMFSTWAQKLSGKLGTMESAMVTLGSVDGLASVIDAFTAAFHVMFGDAGCVSQHQQHEARQWSWINIPLRMLFSSVRTHKKNNHTLEESVQKYISALIRIPSSPIIAVGNTGDEEAKLGNIPTCEETFLEDVANNVSNLASGTGFNMFLTATNFGSIDSVCTPDLMISALTARLEKLISAEGVEESLKNGYSEHAVETAVAIASICSRQNMIFPSRCLDEDMAKLFLKRCELKSNLLAVGNLTEGMTMAMTLFREIVLAKHLQNVHILAWDMFAKSYSLHQQHVYDFLFRRNMTNVSESLMNALQNSVTPRRICECVLDIYKSHEDKKGFASGLVKAGLTTEVMLLLTHIQTGLKDSQHADIDKLFPLQLDCMRASCMLDIISNTATLSHSATSRQLLHSLCDMVTTIDPHLQKLATTTNLHTSIMCCIVITAHATVNLERLSYIIQAGVLSHCTKVLKTVPLLQTTQTEPTLLQQSDSLISSIVCLFLLFLHSKHETLREQTKIAITKELPGNSPIWECLLHPSAKPFDAHVTSRLTNCCILLQTIISNPSCSTDVDKIHQSYISPCTTILLANAAATPSPMLKQAAYSLLLTLRMKNEKAFLGTAPHSIVLILTDLTISYIAANEGAHIPSSALQYLRHLVMNGHADGHLNNLQAILLKIWKQWNKNIDSSLRNDDDRYSDETRRSTLGELFFAIRDRLKDASNKVSLSSVQQPTVADLNSMRTCMLHNNTNKSNTNNEETSDNGSVILLNNIIIFKRHQSN